MKSARFQMVVLLLLMATGCHDTHKRSAFGDFAAIDTVFTSRIDSLEWVFHNPRLPLEARLVTCDKLAYELVYVDVNRAKNYAQLGLSLLEGVKNDSLAGLFYRDLGMAYHLMEKYDTAHIYYDKSMRIAVEMKNENVESFLYLAYGLMYSDMSQYQLSAQYYEKALKLCEKNGFQQRYSTIISNIGITYLKMKNYELAEKYFLEARDSFLKKPYPSGLAHVYLNLGIMYIEQERFEEAGEASAESLHIFQSVGDKTGEALALMNMAQLLTHEKAYQESLETTQKSLQLASEAGYPYVIKNALAQLSHIYYQMGNYRQSEYYGLKYLALIDSVATTEIMLAQRQIIPVYIQQFKRNEAIVALERYDSLVNRVNKTEVQNAYLEMQTKYETEKKELEIERQQFIIAKQNTQRWVLLASTAVCFIILVLLWFLLHLRNRNNRFLAEMNTTKDKFFSIISHDLKNPALAQRDALLLLVKNAQTWDADTLTEYYHELLKSAEGEVELIYHLLNWAQLQTGRMNYNPTSFNLLARLSPDLSLIRKMAESKQITFQTNIPEDLFLTADSDMISTVIRNLLTNAIKFTSHGAISLSASPSPPDRTGKACLAPSHLISISDTGIGMNEDQLRSLFTLDRPKGMAHEHSTGLGLIVCKELLEKHGSTLHVQSEAGKGSAFWFSI